MTTDPPQGVRARARAELLADVSRVARSHLAAPDDTIDPALRISRVLIELAADITPSNLLLRARDPLHPTLVEQLANATNSVE